MVSKVEKIKIEDENNGNADNDNNVGDAVDNSFEDDEQVDFDDHSEEHLFPRRVENKLFNF
jgi:hypothetical protein